MNNINQSRPNIQGTQYLSSQTEKVIQGPTQHSYSAYSTSRSHGPSVVHHQEYTTTGPVMTRKESGSRQRSVGAGSIGGSRHVTTEHGNTTSYMTREGTYGGSIGGAINVAHTEQSLSGQARHYVEGRNHSQHVTSTTGGAWTSGQSRHVTEGTAYTTGHVVNTYQGKERVVDVRVVGVERGEERLVSTTEHEGESVMHERYESQRIKVPKKIIREEVIEKVYVVPETIIIEEYVEDEVEIEEKIVEVAKKIIIEKIVEIPEIEIIEKIIEVPETVVREKIREVAKIETVERIVEVPVEQIVERCVSVPQIEYKDVPVEKIVEVPEIRTEEIIREVYVPQHTEKGIERIKYIEDAFDLERKLPVPVEAEVVFEYCLPEIVPRYSKKKFPVYLPRFIEVPIAKQFADSVMLSQGETYNARVHSLTTVQPAMSLCEIENLAKEVKDADYVKKYEMSVQSGQYFEKMVQTFQSESKLVGHMATGNIHAGASGYAGMTSGASGYNYNSTQQYSSSQYDTGAQYRTHGSSMMGASIGNSMLGSTAMMSGARSVDIGRNAVSHTAHTSHKQSYNVNQSNILNK